VFRVRLDDLLDGFTPWARGDQASRGDTRIRESIADAGAGCVTAYDLSHIDTADLERARRAWEDARAQPNHWSLEFRDQLGRDLAEINAELLRRLAADLERTPSPLG
jgi:hypothetical protein